MKKKSHKNDLVIEELMENRELLPWRSLQGIKDEMLLIFVLSRVATKEFNLDEMVIELHNIVMLLIYLLVLLH